ncbi:SCO family protein [Pseudoalteromonas sp. OOF1S-7]|uniref:SCO family protein n=1 Tax=Pseudoalteromonas sp. OOF1S-7 TaxID=2917757 RepID=UPI001EF3D779|nr:SCO family protein [Pseudoalteromonas sp. OOF1S-7]MCG7537785.1 SCO family protein [Pseudoalteromonas sp. OOF1S-7]
MRNFFLLFFMVMLFSGCQPAPKISEFAVHYEQPRMLKPFTLQDQHGMPVTAEQLKGQWSLLFLGYTHCPDVCPMTLAKLTNIAAQLESYQNLNVWFVAVDPQRDTQEKRKQYIDYFNPDFVAASAPHNILFPFVRDIGLIYAINSSDQPEYYVDHSASIALVNPQAQLEAIFKPEFKVGEVPVINEAQLIKDFKVIVPEY